MTHDDRREPTRPRDRPAGRKATEALSKLILVNMFARSLQGRTPEDAAKWAAAMLRKVYGA
jgi:hypothetical protein